MSWGLGLVEDIFGRLWTASDSPSVSRRALAALLNLRRRGFETVAAQPPQPPGAFGFETGLGGPPQPPEAGFRDGCCATSSTSGGLRFRDGLGGPPQPPGPSVSRRLLRNLLNLRGPSVSRRLLRNLLNLRGPSLRVPGRGRGFLDGRRRRPARFDPGSGRGCGSRPRCGLRHVHRAPDRPRERPRRSRCSSSSWCSPPHRESRPPSPADRPPSSAPVSRLSSPALVGAFRGALV